MIRTPEKGATPSIGTAGVVPSSRSENKGLPPGVARLINSPAKARERRVAPSRWNVEVGGCGGQGVIASGASAAGTGRPTGREGGGLPAVAVAGAYYILHLRESTPASRTNHRERRLAGDSR
jgi:hypothetical protein